MCDFAPSRLLYAHMTNASTNDVVRVRRHVRTAAPWLGRSSCLVLAVGPGERLAFPAQQGV